VGDTSGLDAEFGMFSISGEPEPVFGVDENDLSTLTITPNPASGNTVVITSPIANEKLVVVYDVQGKKVIEAFVDRNLDVSSLTAGVYMVKISQNGSSVTKKLIKR
jgi:Secretion system C-terminal sorting domain